MTIKTTEPLEKRVYLETLRKAMHNYDEMVAELSTLRLLNDAIQGDLGFNEICCKLVHFVTETMSVEKASVMVLDQEKKVLKLRVAKSFYQEKPAVYFEKPWSGKAFKLGEGIAGYVAKHRKSILINDTHRDARFVRFRGQKVNVRSILSLPLAHGDRVHGALNLSNSEPGAFDGRKEHALNLIASAASVALDHARLSNESKRLNDMLSARDKELDAVVSLSESLRSNTDLDSVLGTFLRNILDAFEADTAAVFLRKGQTGSMELRRYGTRGKNRKLEPLLNSLMRRLVEETAGPRCPVSFRFSFQEASGRSKSRPWSDACIGVPLVFGRNHLGIFVLLSRSEKPLEGINTTLLVSLCNQLAVAVQAGSLILPLS